MRERRERAREAESTHSLARAQELEWRQKRLSLSFVVDVDAFPFFNSLAPPRHSLDQKKQYYPDGELAADAAANARRYARLAAEAADATMPPPTRGDLPDDVFDVLQRQVGFDFGDYERGDQSAHAERGVGEKKPSWRRRDKHDDLEIIEFSNASNHDAPRPLPNISTFLHLLLSSETNNSAKPAPRPKGDPALRASSQTRRTACPRTS